MSPDRIVTRTAPPVSVIIPVYDEEGAVGANIEAVRRVLAARGIPHEIVVVDDGSTDRTAEEARRAGAKLLRHPDNRGYGAALKTGIAAARYDTIVIIDADGTYPADPIPDLVARLETADMAVGARIGKNVHIPWIRRPAKWMVGWLATRIAGRPIPDLNSGLRAFRRECALQYFPILSSRFSFTTTLTLAFVADDYHVVYHPIDYFRRVGKSKVTPRRFMDFATTVLRIAMLFQPLRIFVPLSLACTLLGTLKVLFDIAALFPRSGTASWSLLFQQVVSTSAILLLLAALQLLLVGMVADGVLRRIAQHQRPLVPSRAVPVSEAPADHGG